MMQVAFLGLLLAASAWGDDPCVSQIPTELRALIEKEFPQYRLPLLVDDSPGGPPGMCHGTSTGDFDGDGQGDVAVLLRSTTDTMLIACLRVGSTWRLTSLRTLGAQGQAAPFVATAKPGAYAQFEHTEKLERGEVRSFHSTHDGILTGTAESSLVGYFWTKAGWVHVWLAN
jgi:hypothetical protein